MAGGGGSVISAEAFKEIKEAMSALVAVSQMQADSLISIQRKADVSEYGMDGCDGLVDQCVKGEGQAVNGMFPIVAISSSTEPIGFPVR